MGKALEKRAGKALRIAIPGAVQRVRSGVMVPAGLGARAPVVVPPWKH
jgi:hypothetical protein